MIRFIYSNVSVFGERERVLKVHVLCVHRICYISHPISSKNHDILLTYLQIFQVYFYLTIHPPICQCLGLLIISMVYIYHYYLLQLLYLKVMFVCPLGIGNLTRAWLTCCRSFGILLSYALNILAVLSFFMKVIPETRHYTK